jgi:hypothetical protein
MSDIITGVTNSLLAENEWAGRRIAALEAELAAKSKDAEVVRVLQSLSLCAEVCIMRNSWRGYDDVHLRYSVNAEDAEYHIYAAPTLYNALVAAGLMDEEGK